MGIHTTEGHLTATNKRHLRELLKCPEYLGKWARVNRIEYLVENVGNNQYKVAIWNSGDYLESRPDEKRVFHAYFDFAPE